MKKGVCSLFLFWAKAQKQKEKMEKKIIYDQKPKVAIQ